LYQNGAQNAYFKDFSGKRGHLAAFPEAFSKTNRALGKALCITNELREAVPKLKFWNSLT
jgi:hypothetical protein